MYIKYKVLDTCTLHGLCYLLVKFSLHISHCLWIVVAKPECTTWTPAAVSMRHRLWRVVSCQPSERSGSVMWECTARTRTCWLRCWRRTKTRWEEEEDQLREAQTCSHVVVTEEICTCTYSVVHTTPCVHCTTQQGGRESRGRKKKSEARKVKVQCNAGLVHIVYVPCIHVPCTCIHSPITDHWWAVSYDQWRRIQTVDHQGILIVILILCFCTVTLPHFI